MENIINFFKLSALDIPLYIIFGLFSIAMIVFKKHFSLPLQLFLYSIIVIISSFFKHNSYMFFGIAILFLILFIVFKIKNKELDYSKPILNIAGIINLFKKDIKNEDEKIIGSIIPYNKNQVKYNNRSIKFNYTAACGGTMISGATGSGKTYGMKSLIFQDIDNGHSVAFFEYKGDEKLVKELSDYGYKKGIKVYKMSFNDIDFDYDPLSELNETAKVEALLNTRKWSIDGGDEHYRFSTQLLIQKMVGDFDKIWDGKSNYTYNFYKFVTKYNYDRASYDAYCTVLKMLEILLTSHLAPMWKGKFNRKFSFGIKEQYLVIFSFMSSNKSLANSVSSFAFRDLLECGTKNPFSKALCLYVDEYGTLENSYVIKDIFEKGRSCGIAPVISLQDINQIVINTNQAYLNSILGTINTFIIYSGATKTTAEMLSGVQIYDIDKILLTLRKPIPQRKISPTALFITKYPSIEKDKSVDVFKITPYTYKREKTNNINNTENYKIENNNVKKYNVEENFKKPTEEIESNKIDYNSFI